VACLGGVPREPERTWTGYRRGVLVSVLTRVGAVCESVVARAARPRAGEKGGRGPGNRGNPGFGGVSRVPWRLAGFHVRQERRAIHAFAARNAAPWALSTVMRGGFALHVPRSSVRAGTGFTFAASSVMCAAGSTVRAVPDWSPLVSVYSRSRDGVSPTSVTSRLGVGVRSGKRRRHAASTSVQAAGGTEPEPRRTAPASAGATLCASCVDTVPVVYEAPIISESVLSPVS
jgi:hypothetical protein